jgi:hypothetical protein
MGSCLGDMGDHVGFGFPRIRTLAFMASDTLYRNTSGRPFKEHAFLAGGRTHQAEVHSPLGFTVPLGSQSPWVHSPLGFTAPLLNSNDPKLC